MKKFLFFLYIVIFSFSFFIYFDLISSKQEDSMKKAGKEDSFVVTINENALKIDSEKFLSLLFRVSDDYNANVFKSIYSEKKSVEYVYFTHDIDSYFTKFLLLDGVFPDNKSDKFNISTLKDESVTGEIFSYKEGIDFSVKPLKSFPKDRSVAGDYIVSLKDKNKINPFINKLQRELGMRINYSSYEYNSVIDSSSWLKIVPIILLYILSLFMIIYYYFLEYKNSAIRLLNGYAPVDIWRKYFLQISKLYFWALIISTIVVITFITIKNLLFNLYWFKIIIDYLFYQSIIGIIVCFIMSLLFVKVGKISISASIKNKKPLKQIQIVNSLVKVIFSVIILYLLFVSYSAFLDSYRYYYKNATEWKQMNSYGVMPTKALLPSGNDPKAILEMFDKKYKLFKYTNDRGAILVRFSDVYRAKQIGLEVEGVSVYEEKTLLINNNYLKLNPIYGLDNKLIDIKEDDDRLTVLVPEKYKKEEQELRRYFEEEYYFQKYKVKNTFLKDAGKELPLKEDIVINIIWIKNNQSYFTFSNDIAADTNNRFYDGIAMVLTNANGNEAAWYDTVVGSNGYFIKLLDKEVPYNNIKDQIKNLGLQEFYPVLYNAYDRVESKIQMHMERAYQFLVILFVVLLGYLFISMFTTLNYLEQYKLKHTIKIIHGYSYFKRHKLYLIFTNFIWFVSILILCILEKFDFIYLMFCILFLENLFIYLLIKKSEHKKMVQIIKEG
ncbi:DUF1430 domain-containing protein [Bacillus pfraonensis]|uniref:DUF1430 domain-containing protein n=1 Tax=Bacillus TaxID=1386 RepID=UPI003012B37D